jgi:hypothetical protein
MFVFAVVEYSVDGYSLPLRIFSTREKANNFIVNSREAYLDRFLSVVEYIVDEF